MDIEIEIDGHFDAESSSSTGDRKIISQLLAEYNESLQPEQHDSVNKKNNKQEQEDLQTFFNEIGWNNSNKVTNVVTDLCASKRDIESVLRKSVITSDFEKLHSVPPLEVSERKLKEERKKLAQLTKGKKWYGLPATEMSDEVKRDLEVIQMRSALDPKRFYKKNDLKVLPKYFQMGKVMDSPLDFHSSRLTKKERKRTLVDELLANAEFTKYNKRKYKEIVQEKQKTHYGAWKKAKKFKKNK